MNEEEIEKGRLRDRKLTESYFAKIEAEADPE
jgi:hypothetical protein